MKKMIKSLIAAIGVALLMTGSTFAATTETIGDVEALKAFAAKVNSGTSYEGDTVTLSADLDLAGVEWTPIGVGTRSSKSYTGKAFKGTFDGGNHTISGLTITSTDSDDAAVGLFGVVDGGTVKNLKLDAVNINVASSDLAGGAIGLMVNNAKAENITVGGSIVGNDGVGGIVGRLIISGTISSCTNNASVTSSYGGIGGIVGKAYYEDGANTALFASVDKCVNNGTITAPMYVGGIVGLARANVIGCINNGVVVGGTQTGGIVGQLMAAGTVSNNENNAKISGKNHLGGIIGDYSQSNAYTYNNVTIANNINRGELAATEQRAAILGCNNIDGFTAMTASGNVSFYNAEGLELFGNPEDMVIDQTNMFNPAAKIGETIYATFAEALTAAKAMTGDVTVEIYEKVTLNSALSGNYSSITFVGKDTDAEIYLEVQGYITATGKTVNFQDLKLSKSQGGYVANAGFMNLAFGVYDVATVNYTNCTFLNGAYASSGAVTFSNCTFYRSHDRYGLWAYGAQNIVVDGCTFADIRGIKMYDEGKFGTTSITVKNTSFAAVTDKPAIVLTYGNSVTLDNNTYNADKGTFELDLDGNPNGVTVTSDVPPTCINDNGACGVLVDGKIYTTVAQAAAVAISGSTVTLLHSSTETVELAEGVILNKNGFTADGVTVAQPVAKIGDVKYATLQDAISAVQVGETITLIGNIDYVNVACAADSTTSINVPAGKKFTLDLNGYTISGENDANKSFAFMTICVGADVTIDDTSAGKTGKITYKSTRTEANENHEGYTIRNQGNLTLNGGKIENATELASNGKEKCVTVAVNNGTSSSGKAATFTMNGGEVVSETYFAIRSNVYANNTVDADAVVVALNGGTVYGLHFCDWGTANLNYQVAVGENAVVECGKYPDYPGQSLRLVNAAKETTVVSVEIAENAQVKGDIYSAGTRAKIGNKCYTKLAAAIAALKDGDTLVILSYTITDGAVKLPATLNNVTIKGSEGTVLKDMTISAADGNSYSYKGLTFDGITFDNSRLLFTGWRNGEETIEDLTIVNCEFKNLNDTTSTAPIHINKDASEPVKNFTFRNNKIDGATGGSKSGIYLQATGNVVIENNVINNVAFRPYVIQITTDDGIADNFVVSGNTFSGSAVGRAQGLGNNSDGTDSVVLNVNNNIFKGITDAQQICYWNFNATTTTADLSNNYYDIDIVANPGKIYYNSAAADTVDLIEKGVYPYYTELNADGTIKVDSLVEAPAIVAQIGNTKYLTLVDAFKAATSGCTIEILSDVVVDYYWDARNTGAKFTVPVTINGNGKTIKFTNTVYDGGNYLSAFRFEAAATVNNLTIDMSEAVSGFAGRFRAISAKGNLTVDNCSFIGNGSANNTRAIIFGEGAGAATADVVVSITNSTFTGWKRGVTDNENAQDVKSVTITGNTFKNANVAVSAAESVIFTGNTMDNGIVNIKSYATNNVLSVTAQDNTLTDSADNYICAKTINAQEGFTAERVPFTVSTYEQLIAALAEDNAYVVLANDITATATQSSGYGKAGIVVEAGDVLDGNGKTLTINGANATWDCVIAMKGGEVRNLTIAGAMRGVFMPGANGDVVIDNCKFQDVIYTFNSDGGSKDYTVTIKNTELNGWTSFSDAHKDVVFDTCTFAEGNGYAYCRPYQATTFKDCSFSDDFAFDCSKVADNKLAFNGCTYNGQAITSENAFDLFGDGAKVLVNGAPADYTRVAEVGGQIFADLQEAIKAAAPAGTVTLLKDVVVDEWKMVTEDYNIASGELITLTMNGLTIDGNDKTLTVKAIESAGNGGYLFQGASSLTVKDLTINQPAGMGGIALKAGTIENVTFNGGKYAVLPGSGDVIVKDCTFNGITGYAVYFEEDRDNLEITGNTFNCADGAYAVTLRGAADFTNNTVNTGKVNLANSAKGEVSGNDFGTERFKVYNGATATIENNTINNLVFNDANVPQNSTFTGNTLSESAQAVLDAMNFVAKIGDKYYATLQAALDAAAAGTGNVTVEILSDIDLTGTDWNPVTVSAPGYPFVTVNGNGKTITGLNDMLFAGTWAGKSGLVINDLTIADSTIVNDENDAQGTVGVGAFVGYPQASATITLNNCHLRNSTVKGGHWTGGLIGMAGGYSGNDGPVFMTLTIDGCSVTGSTITGKGSAGGIIGHGSCSAWTDVIVVNSTVSGNTITSTGSSNNKAGSVMGTIGAAGQPTTVNGVTKTGGMSVSVTTAGNTVKSADTLITTIYGRQGTATGLLEIAGGSYEANPIEEGVAYASPIDGYKIAQNADGTYGLKSALPGEGTEASPYIIATVEDLVYFRDYVNSGKTKFNAPGVYIALGDNIDLSSIDNWIPIGVQEYDAKYVPVDPTKVFRGIFDGNGRVISNLKMSKTLGGADPANDAANLGLFGVTGEGAVVKNLTISNVTVNSDGRNVAAVVGHAHKTTLENITVNGKIEITGGHYVAGVCGLTRTMVAGKNLTVSGGAGSFINGQNMVGGIFPEIQALWGLGYSQSFSSLAVENIAINGRGGVGGILGMLAGNGTVTDVSVKNVVLTGRTDYQGDAMGRIRMGLVAGLMGGNGPETIANIVAENVSGKNLDGNAVVLPVIGANYDASSNATEAKIGDKYYATFAKAYAAAQAGDTIELLADIEASEVILIDKNLTINGNGHKVTSSATRVFRVTTGDTEVTLNDVNMVSTAVRVGTNDIRGISVDDVNNVKLTLNNCSVDFTDASANDWAYAVNVTGGSNHTLTVNGGIYEGANVINVRGANNSVVVENATLNSLYPDNDRYYGAGIWVLQNQGSSVKATGNTFNGTNALAFNLGTGTSLTASNNTDNTSVGAAFAVAKIGDKGYMTLASAIAAVKNGETIVLVKDSNENVTISQKAGVSFEIDGNDKTYTGKFTVKGRNNDAAEETLVIKNVKFETSVDSHVFIDATVNKVQNLTVEACVFTNNDASTVQGLKIRTASNITVKECNADGLYYLVNNTSGGRNLVIDNCVVNGFYGARIHNNIDAIVKNSTFNTEVHAIVLDAGNSAVTTIENCNITVTRADRYAVYYNVPSNGRTLVVNGDNNTFTVNAAKWNNAVKSGDYKIVLNDADLAAPDMAAKIGNVYYNSLSYAIEDAQDNDEVKLIREINIADETADLLAGKYKSFFRIAGKNVTVDFNGNYILGNYDSEADDMLVGVFSAEQNGHLVLKGEGGIDLTATDTVYCLLTAFDSTASLTVESGTYKLDKASSCLIYADGSEIVWVKGGNFELGNVGTGNNGSPWIFNATGNNTKHVHVSGGTFNADVMHQYWEFEVQAPHDMMLACKSNGNGTWTILPAVAYVKESSSTSQGYIKEVGYATFAEAIAAAERTGGEMTILAGTYDENLNVNKGVTVVGETDENGNNLVNFNGKLNVTANDATVRNINVNNGSDSAGYINAKDVLIEGCSVVGGNGFRYCYTSGTVTFRDSTITGAVYGIHFDGSAGGNIVIDNCEITGWTSFAGTITNVAISDTEFKNGNYNQLRFYQNAELTNVKFNENMTVDFGKNDVDASFTGCTVVDTNADGIVKPLTDVIYKGDIVDMGVDVTIDGVPMYVDAKIGDTFYLTIADAIAAAHQAGDTIKLVRDIDLGGAKITVPAGKNITIDLNGKTVSGVHGAEYAMIHVQNGADMTIDDTVGGGKITCAAGGNNVGAAIWVEGALVQNAGTIELTGTWTLGFNVDLRPNAWGTAHTVPASFVMNGGKIVSTDTAVRVASNSSDSYPELGVNFTMNGGEIESAWDAIFVQHLYAGDLNINVENGSVSGANSALRIYGDTGSDVDILVKNGVFTGPIKIAEAYVGTDAIAISGGVFSVPVEESCCAEGYIPVAYADGTYGVKPGVFTVRLNGAGFETLQAALDAAQAGDNEIVLLDDSDETVIVSQTEGVNITIDGDGYTYTGRINVHGNSRFSDETLTIMNFDFYTEKASHNFIWSDSQVAPARYPHNVTIVDCAFEAGRDVVDSVVGIRLRQGNNINVVNCSAYRLHSLIQATSCGGDGIYVESVEIDKCKNGMSFGTSNFSVVDSEIDTTGAGSYGIRADGSGAYTATVEDCVIDAYIPVLVRNTADDGFTLTVAGDNHFMADNGLMENGESYLVVFSKGDVDAEKAPVAPETTFNLVIEDGSLDPSKVYPGFEALVGTKYFGQLEDAVAAAQNGDTVTVLKNVGTDAAIIVNKVIAIDLNGKTIAATQNDTAGDGVFCVVAPGVLTINDSVGTGVINGVGDNNYNMAIWAKDGGKVVINGGSFTNVGATDTNDPNAHFDLIYVKNGGEVVVNGGHFECETPAFTLNSHDTLKGTITVNGGTFVGFDPRNNAAETAGTTFMAPGKFTMANGNNYVVVEPGSYMLNGVYCAKGTVADIDAAVAGAVTLTTIDGVITAKATFTFKVTAVDTVNPENSPYELTGGTLRPGKTVAVKYIDLATGEESWAKPESDTVTFKLVIK